MPTAAERHRCQVQLDPMQRTVGAEGGSAQRIAAQNLQHSHDLGHGVERHVKRVIHT